MVCPLEFVTLHRFGCLTPGSDQLLWDRIVNTSARATPRGYREAHYHSLRRGFCEAYLSAKSEKKGKNTRFSSPDAYTRWPFDPQITPSQGPSRTDGLSPRVPGRVSTRRQFAEFSTPSGRGQSGLLRIVFVAHPEQTSRDVAFAISRKVGNAVVRNRIRRRLRALMDDFYPALQPGLYLIKCANGCGQLSYDEIKHHLQSALARSGAL